MAILVPHSDDGDLPATSDEVVHALKTASIICGTLYKLLR